MKKIKEETSGGEVVAEDRTWLSSGVLFDCFPKKGETTARIQKTTYEAELKIPYTVTIQEELAPALDTEGKPKRERETRVTDVDVSFPFKYGRATGRIEMFVYVPDGISEDKIAQQIAETIGNALVELEHRKSNER